MSISWEFLFREQEVVEPEPESDSESDSESEPYAASDSESDIDPTSLLISTKDKLGKVPSKVILLCLMNVK